MRRIVPGGLSFIVLAGCYLAAPKLPAQEFMPFRTRNASPPVAIFGLPAWNAPKDAHAVGLTSELVSHFRIAQRGGESLLLDGETWRNSFYYDRRVGKRWSFGAELPFYRHSGGFLDDAVDGWHSLFGLPDGGRNLRPENQLLFMMQNGNGQSYRLAASVSGVGDAQFNAGYSFGRRGGLFARLTVKLPTGDERELTGSGSADVAASLLHSREAAVGRRRGGYFLGVGAIRAGDAEALFYPQRELSYFAVAGGGLKVLPRFGVKVQFDVHTAFYRSGLGELGESSVLGSFGGWWQADERHFVDFAIGEDIEVGSAPDVTLHFGFRWIL